MTEVITPPRSDVPVDRTWDAESVFASAEAWEAALEALLADLPRLEGLAGRLGEGPEVTIEALVARDDLMRRTGHVFVYAYLDYAVDTALARTRSRASGGADGVRPGARSGGVHRARAPRAGTRPARRVVGREARAAPYEHYLDDLFRRGEHVRSVEVEELLGQLADAHTGPYAVYSRLVDGDLTFADATAESGDTAGGQPGLGRGCSQARTGCSGRAPGRATPTASARSERAHVELRDRDQDGRLLGQGAPTSRRVPRRSSPRTSRWRCSTTSLPHSSGICRRGTGTGRCGRR